MMGCVIISLDLSSFVDFGRLGVITFFLGGGGAFSEFLRVKIVGKRKWLISPWQAESRLHFLRSARSPRKKKDGGGGGGIPRISWRN